MTREVMAAVKELARSLEAARREGLLKLPEGREAMAFDKDDILEALGLKTRSTVDWLGTAAIGFGVGALVGATFALMLAPRRGDELRGEILERGRRIVDRGRQAASEQVGADRS